MKIIIKCYFDNIFRIFCFITLYHPVIIGKNPPNIPFSPASLFHIFTQSKETFSFILTVAAWIYVHFFSIKKKKTKKQTVKPKPALLNFLQD